MCPAIDATSGLTNVGFPTRERNLVHHCCGAFYSHTCVLLQKRVYFSYFFKKMIEQKYACLRGGESAILTLYLSATCVRPVELSCIKGTTSCLHILLHRLVPFFLKKTFFFCSSTSVRAAMTKNWKLAVVSPCHFVTKATLHFV